MITYFTKKTCLLLLLSGLCLTSQAQKKGASTDSTRFKTISAGAQYKRSVLYRFFFGSNYRSEWTTPVTIPVMYLDTLKGGLLSIKEGGSNQSKSLHLRTKGDKEYAFRSVDKTLDKVIPKPFYNTFVADVVNDEISMSNPYGALAVPIMAHAAGIYHTNPQYFYLPEQPALDTLKKDYANGIYLFEKRPQGDWSDAGDMGNFKKIEDTEDVIPDIRKDHRYKIDQLLFARNRLLDMMIGDFDRHADQWKWGVNKKGDQTIYEPIPTDRDQAFSTRNGLALNLIIALSGMKFLQSYGYKISDVKALATINRLLDRRFTNELILSQWQDIARDLQVRLTDSVIEASVKAMPQEIFAIRGKTLIAKLKARRGDLVSYATTYYGVMAESSEVVGTAEDDYFEINNGANKTTQVNIYHLNKNRIKADTPYYSRLFVQKETDEINVYGISGNDIYQINGKLNDEIGLRIIGGNQRDSVLDATTQSEKKKYKVYDDADNYFENNRRMKLHLSNDSAVHEYDYEAFLPDKKGFIPHFGYNDPDRIFVGLRYSYLNNKWRKRPYVYKQSIDVNYSINQMAFSTTYNGLFPTLFGKWDFITHAYYDGVRWMNFYGLGNETSNITRNRDFYRMRTEEAAVSLGVGRIMGKNKVKISGFYNRVKILADTARFVYKNITGSQPNLLQPDQFAGLQLDYAFADVNDSILPTKGFTFVMQGKHTQNLISPDKSFQTVAGNIQLFIPLSSRFSMAFKTGGATIAGTPEFYQYPKLGESFNLRGYRRERFSGKSTLYGSSELRYIKNVRSYIFNGKAGLLAFVDNGRVWMPGEASDKIHTTYGGGILLAPFGLVSAAVTYAISEDFNALQFRLGILF